MFSDKGGSAPAHLHEPYTLRASNLTALRTKGHYNLHTNDSLTDCEHAQRCRCYVPKMHAGVDPS